MPQQPLPLFEGQTVHGAQLKLTGTAGGSHQPHAIGDELYVICRGTVIGVDHTDKDDLLVRVHKVKVDQIREVPDSLHPDSLMAQAELETSGQGRLDYDPEG